MSDNGCRCCGKCCSYEIPLTLLDVHRFATRLLIDDRSSFEFFVDDKISEVTGLFLMRKLDDGRCPLLTKEGTCKVHDTKPRGCWFYTCDHESHPDGRPIPKRRASSEERVAMIELDVSSTETKSYISRNGAKWNEEEYKESLKSILEDIAPGSFESFF